MAAPITEPPLAARESAPATEAITDHFADVATASARHTSTAPGFFTLAVIALSGQMLSNVYPVMIGALASLNRASPPQLGQLATAEYIAMALASMFAGKVLARTSPRVVLIGAAVVQVIGAVMTTHAAGYQLLPVRALFAAACGVHIWLLYEFIARSSKPGRLVGFCTTAVALGAIVTSWLGSTHILPKFGFGGLIAFFTIPNIVVITCIFWLPRSLPEAPTSAESTATAQGKVSWASRWILASALTWSAWISVLWVYAEPMAHTIGISESAGRAFAVASLSASLVGAALGTALSERWPPGRVLSVFLLVGVGHVCALLLGIQSTAFVVWAAVFGFVGYFLVPFFVKALVAVDVGRSSIVFFPVMQYAGAALGPFLASWTVSEGEYRGGLLTDLALIVAATVCLWLGMLCFRWRRAAS